MQAAGELDEDSEEDADFDMKSADDDEGEPSDESDAESGDAEMIDEQPKVCASAVSALATCAVCDANHSCCCPLYSAEACSGGFSHELTRASSHSNHRAYL